MKHTASDLIQMQSLPLTVKIQMTERRVKEWYDYWNGDVYLGFSGGKDSTVLKHIIDSMGLDIPAVFVNTGLEYPEIQSFVRDVQANKYSCFNNNVEIIRPKMRFDEVIKKYGYPAISKETAEVIYYAKHGKKCQSTRMQRLNGEQLDKNGNRSKFNCAKWKFMLQAPFEVSAACCRIMKKAPSNAYAKQTGRKQIIATMADESRLRYQSWIHQGCNAFHALKPTSQPMSFWTEQDVLHYLKEYNVPYCSVYGDIVTEDGTENLKTTRCTRTGCIFCMFGCHLEKEPNRFQQLKKTHPRQYQYCINGGEYNAEGIWQPSKDGLGLGKVLDYINVKYE